MKYTEVLLGFSEVPGEISLCINISGCPLHCEGCHSPHLWEDIGTPLTTSALDALFKCYQGITCISFMGGDAFPEEIKTLAQYVKEKDLKVCWYSGKDEIPDKSYLKYLDYIKVGHYDKTKGGLGEETTNQRFYQVIPEAGYKLIDLSYKFKKIKKEL